LLTNIQHQLKYLALALLINFCYIQDFWVESESLVISDKSTLTDFQQKLIDKPNVRCATLIQIPNFVFLAALFLVANRWKQPKCLPTDN
jgi:hypothetical protein